MPQLKVVATTAMEAENAAARPIRTEPRAKTWADVSGDYIQAFYMGTGLTISAGLVLAMGATAVDLAQYRYTQKHIPGMERLYALASEHKHAAPEIVLP